MTKAYLDLKDGVCGVLRGKVTIFTIGYDFNIKENFKMPKKSELYKCCSAPGSLDTS
jgi:hypothetical protein